MRFYTELAEWWPLFSPPSEYVEEAEDLLPRLNPRPGETMLELGSGGGSLAWHLKRHYALMLSDLSPGMLAVSRALNPECEHVVGDMRTMRLDRTFDVVLVHDAIMYATTHDDVVATLRTAAVHCRPGGTIVVLPDCVQETFTPGTECDGHDADDRRGLRYLEWRWDPNPEDETYVVDYVFVLRAADGAVTVEHDRHVEGVFSREQWLKWFADVGLSVERSPDPFGRDVFLARKLS